MWDGHNSGPGKGACQLSIIDATTKQRALCAAMLLQHDSRRAADTIDDSLFVQNCNLLLGGMQVGIHMLMWQLHILHHLHGLNKTTATDNHVLLGAAMTFC